MKCVLRLCCALMAALGLVSCSLSSATSALIGRPAPPTHFIMLDGTQVSIEQFKGRPMAIVFWCLRCPYSERVLERLNKYMSEGGRTLRVLAVSVDQAEDLGAVSRRASSLPFLEHAFSGNDIHDEAYTAFEVDRLPLIFVLDAQGAVVAVDSSERVVYEQR